MDNYSILDDITSNLVCRIKLAFFTRHVPNWSESKTNVHYTLWNVSEGNIWIKINKKEFFATAGDVIIFYPGDTYKASTDENGCCFVFTHFVLEMGNGVDILTGMNMAGIVSNKFLGTKGLEFCEQFRKEYTSAQHISLKMYAIYLSFLSDLFYTAREHGCHFHDNVTTPGELTIHSILNYMNAHYTESISMKDLADFANMSEKYFIFYFRYRMGIPPNQYLIECRMKRATDLLADPGNKIRTIASELGYADQYSFSKAFRKFYDKTPTAFRNQFLY